MTRAGRNHRASSALAASIVAVALFASALVPSALAIGADKAEVVLVLDFSGSILDDATTRNQFGAALERIADRVDKTSARPHQGRHDASRSSSSGQGRRRPPLRRDQDARQPVGRQAPLRLPPDRRDRVQDGRRRRTDQVDRPGHELRRGDGGGRRPPADRRDPAHDDPLHRRQARLRGVPASQVQPTRDRLFGSRTPFALLPVGMGLKAAERPTLEAGLASLKTINDMPACSTGATMTWPDVVFQTPEDAGNAVAVALQNATCTFTAAPVATPPGLSNAVENINLAPLDGAAAVDWDPPTTPATGPDRQLSRSMHRRRRRRPRRDDPARLARQLDRREGAGERDRLHLRSRRRHRDQAGRLDEVRRHRDAGAGPVGALEAQRHGRRPGDHDRHRAR